jgi:ferredoxin-NADP reductase
MLAGGIGVTPQCSMIRYATDEALKTSIILLYSNRYEDNTAFEDDFNEMQGRNQNLKVMLTITQPSQNWKGCTGRINRAIIEKVVPDYAERIFYTSGPGPMLDAMSATLREIGLPDTQIKQEYFTGYAGTPKQ